MRFEPTAIPEVLLIHPRVHEDTRGYFMETYHQQRFAEAGIVASFVQANHSRSRRGVLRGLHYQVRQPQGKLVRAVRGELYDVAVDLRRSAGSFGQWVGVRLTDENRLQLWMPPGFAHGFLALSEPAEMAYLCTDLHLPDAERVIRWDDPDLGISWPLTDGGPVLSARDRAGTRFGEAECFP